jgi:Fe-S-cluster containining protein
MTEYNRAEVDFFITALKEEARDIIHQVGASIEPKNLVEGILEELQKLAPKENDTRTEAEIWKQLRERLLAAAYATRPHCIRCGTCCTKSSPTLCEDDFELFRKDVLTPVNTYTIRINEPAYSNVTGNVENSKSELIKIKEVPEQTACVFYDKFKKECSIYEDRPYQCRAQECWNPQALERLESKSRLNRENLLNAVGPLWDIVRRHEEQCSYEDFGRKMAKLEATKGQTVNEIIELLSYDQHVREFAVQNFGLNEETLSFFFGRPLKDYLPAYGLKLEKFPDGTHMLMAADYIG